MNFIRNKKPPPMTSRQANQHQCENYQQYDNMASPAHGANCNCSTCKLIKPPKTSFNNQTRACENYQQYDNMAAHGSNCKCPICGGGKKPPKTSYGHSGYQPGYEAYQECEQNRGVTTYGPMTQAVHGPNPGDINCPLIGCPICVPANWKG